MKKTLSLVLALVMVFALAASASAITGLVNPTVTATTNAPYYDIDLQLIEANVTGLSVLSLQQVAANKAYIYDGVVNFAVYFKTAKEDNITMNAQDYDDAVALISSDIANIYNNTVNLYEYVKTGSVQGVYAIDEDRQHIAGQKVTTAYDNNQYNRLFVDLPAPQADAVHSYVIVGSGAVVVAANGALQVDFLGDRNCLKFSSPDLSTLSGIAAAAAATFIEPIHGNEPHSIWDPIKGKGGTELYRVAKTVAQDVVTYTVTYRPGATAIANAGAQVIFNTSYAATIASGSTNNVTSIQVVLGDNTYLAVENATILAGGGDTALSFYLSNQKVTAAATVTALTAVYNDVMNFFGFKYAEKGVLLPIHFASQFSTFWAKDTEAITLYTGAITIPDASTDVPQTGDAASSIGFVMIALAIVAACGVAYKKVRA